MVKIEPKNLAYIIQMFVILLLFLYIVFKKEKTPLGVDYERIQRQTQKAISQLKAELITLQRASAQLYTLLDSLTFTVPIERQKIKAINNQINILNENFNKNNINYYDSTDVFLLRRLSRP